MAASQAVDPGSTPGWRNVRVVSFYFYSFVSFSGTGVSLLSSPKLLSATIIVTHGIGGQAESVGSPGSDTLFFKLKRFSVLSSVITSLF